MRSHVGRVRVLRFRLVPRIVLAQALGFRARPTADLQCPATMEGSLTVIRRAFFVCFGPFLAFEPAKIKAVADSLHSC